MIRSQDASTKPHGAIVLAAFVVAVTPTLVSFLKVRRYWVPTGDSAQLILRSLDVGSRHTPLLGMPSTAGPGVHHPGPIQAYLLGMVETVVPGHDVGVLVSAFITALAAIAILAVMQRQESMTAVMVVAGFIAISTATLSAEVLATPFNPYVAVVPLGAFLCASSYVGRGDRFCDVVWVVAGTWAAQVHLTMAAIVFPVVIVVGFGIVASSRSSQPRRLAGPALALGALAWTPPLLDVVLHRGGNVRALVSSVVNPEESSGVVGLRSASKVAALAFELPRPLWAQPNPTAWDIYFGSGRLFALAGLGVAVLIVGYGAVAGPTAIRLELCRVALTALAAGVLLTSRIPDQTFNTLALHNYLWLWPVGVFMVAAAGSTVVGVVRANAAWTARPSLAAATNRGRLSAMVVGALGMAMAGLWGAFQVPSIEPDTARLSTITRRLANDLDEADADDVLIDYRSDLDEFSVSVGLGLAMERRGDGPLFSDGYAAGVGEHRTESPESSRTVVFVEFDYLSQGPSCPEAVLATAEPDPKAQLSYLTAVESLAARLMKDPELAPFADDDMSLYAARSLVPAVQVGLAAPSLADSAEFQTLEALQGEVVFPVYLVGDQLAAEAGCQTP